MKRKLFVFLCVIHFMDGYAGEINQLYFPEHIFKTQSDSEIISFLKAYFPDLNELNISLKAGFKKNTKHSKHTNFTLFYHDIEILNAAIKVNTTTSGHILSIKKEHPHLEAFKFFNPEDEQKQWASVNFSPWTEPFWSNDYPIRSQALKLYATNEKAEIVLELNSWSRTHDKTLVFDLQGNALFQFDHSRHVAIDTLVTVAVFNPDPLTTAAQTAGGIYADHGDSNLSWMNAQYQIHQVQATFDNSNSTFYLENPYVVIDDIQVPGIPVATSSSPSFLFDRSQDGFEDANVFYHITTYHNWISSLGYDSLMNLQLVVDPHGFNGWDNSAFNRNGGNPNLIMGEGGVDDAEDADVIIHEYGHGLSWSANNNTFTSNERSGLDEGVGDYLATSYSRQINPFNWEFLFNWDGTVWGGRVANTPNNYPYAGTDIYKTGEIWNCAMSAIYTDLGAIVTDKLMLEALHYFTNTSNLPEAALYVLQSDSVLFGGIHTATICNHFKNKNILDANCQPVGLYSFSKSNAKIELINSLGFAQNQSNVIIKFPAECSGIYKLSDVGGQIIGSGNFKKVNQIQLSPFNLQSGLYFLQIQSGEENSVLKLAKF